jgi:hypothetical protein
MLVRQERLSPSGSAIELLISVIVFVLRYGTPRAPVWCGCRGTRESTAARARAGAAQPVPWIGY